MGALQDLRYGCRLLIKDRSFTLLAALVLAVGIGTTTSAFTIVDGILLRGLPFSRADQIMMVWTRDLQGREAGVSMADLEDWQRSVRTFSYFSFVFSGSFVINEDTRVPEQHDGAWVSSSFFKMLGETPKLGRDFTPQDDVPGAPPAVILADSIWRLRYGGDPSVLGRVLRLNGVAGTVIGVMRPGVKFPNEAEFWMPASHLPPQIRRGPRSGRAYMAIGRLADGVTVNQARAELRTIGDRLAREYPATNAGITPQAEPFVQRLIVPPIRRVLWSLIGAAGFVLLIAISIVANLWLVRASRRSNEIGLRVALGGSRSGVVRQLLVENLLLSLVAGVFGLMLSAAIVQWFDLQTQSLGRPSWMVLEMDGRSLLFFIGVCLGTDLLFGLAPALYVSRVNVQQSIKEGGRGGSAGRGVLRWTSGLVVSELALTIVLLAAAGLLVRSFFSMYVRDVGIETSRLMTLQTLLPARSYPTVESRTTFLRRVEEQLSNVGELEAASTTSNLPFAGGAARQLDIEGGSHAPDDAPTVTMLSVGPSYFETVGVRNLRGRTFLYSDGQPGREAIVVNERLAALYFRNQDPLNRRVRLRDAGNPSLDAWLTIVGVVSNIPQRGNPNDIVADAVAYVPHVQNATLPRNAHLLVRTRVTSERAVVALRESIRAVDPEMALFNARMMDDVLAEQRWLPRIFGTIFTFFAATALIFSAIGVYGVTAYAVAHSTREIGVRMALGAQPPQVVWLFLRRSVMHLAIGLPVGVAAAFAVGNLIESALVGVGHRDPVTLLSIVMLLSIVVLAAGFWPTRRATRLDPLSAIRTE
jgi:putative ABC transport system permease protein